MVAVALAGGTQRIKRLPIAVGRCRPPGIDSITRRFSWFPRGHVCVSFVRLHRGRDEAVGAGPESARARRVLRRWAARGCEITATWPSVNIASPPGSWTLAWSTIALTARPPLWDCPASGDLASGQMGAS